MSFMLALPKLACMAPARLPIWVNLVANKQWGKALIVTDGQLVKLGLLDDGLFAALDKHIKMSYHLFDEVFPNPTEELVLRKGLRPIRAQNVTIIAFGGGS